MSDEQEQVPPEAYDIVAGGHLVDGRFTITGELGGAKVTLEVGPDDEEFEYGDVLAAALPEIAMRVAAAIEEKAEEDRG